MSETATAYTGVQDLRRIARELLEAGDVRVVIGWEDARRGARPVFVTDPADADKLIFDTRCVHNLVTYLNPRRDHVAELGKIGLVVKGCDVKAVAGLLREAQLTRDDAVLIGVRCGGVLEENELPTALALTPENVAPRCYGCDNREPHLVDHLIGEPQPEPPAPALSIEERIEALEALSPGQRWEYWTAQFAKCIRCYACRQVCPNCYCPTCFVDSNNPQWVGKTTSDSDNMMFHLMRAMHMAGRCVECGTCARGCPMGIDLMKFNRKVARIVKDRFGAVAGLDPDEPPALAAFNPDDKQEFIK